MPWLINAAQLDKFRKAQKNVAILDATWHLSSENRNAHEEFIAKRISSAQFFDLNLFVDATSEISNQILRDENKITEVLSQLGITPDHKIIFYDNSKLHTSCRAVWLMKIFGHASNQLYVLDGGLLAWEMFGGKIDSGMPRPVSPKPYPIAFQAQLIRSLLQMKTNLHHPSEQVVDMRHPVRFAGGKESRPGLRSGHIPNSFSFPFMTMFDNEGRFKPIEKIRKQLIGIGLELNDPIITMCGSGITATILNFVLDLMDLNHHSLYPGSWSEWGSEKLFTGEVDLSERPVVTSLE